MSWTWLVAVGGVSLWLGYRAGFQDASAMDALSRFVNDCRPDFREQVLQELTRQTEVLKRRMLGGRE